MILASTSAYRRALLARLELPFECLAPGVEETALPGERAAALVVRLARAKAAAVARQRPEAWVIGSDQLAVLDAGGAEESTLGKPGSAARCLEQLRRCAGRQVVFITAVAVLRHEAHPVHEFSDETRVRFRPASAAELRRYVAREAPFDCAGGFKSEGLGITLCSAIDPSDPTARIGLPLIGLGRARRAVGYARP